ncbi:MAG TPA: heme exporter protein CcmD [Rhodanobacteraceae bacterium]
MSLQSFLAMGGYAGYVWSAYAVFFVVLLIDYLAPVVRHRQLLRQLRARLARQQARQARRPTADPKPQTD